MKHDRFIVPANTKINLKDYDPAYTDGLTDKAAAQAELQQGVQRLAKYQDILYAQDSYALLILFQAMDAAGKDSTIKHVMSGVNPQGCQVYSFKSPSSEELDHDYLWRSNRALPERGRIGIFNRSYYEETLVVRVHPELLVHQKLPPEANGKEIWDKRFKQINHFEQYLVENGIVVLKFFLNVSKEQQKKRFLARINEPEKNWKFSVSDAKERQHWDQYMEAFEDVFNNTSTSYAPWYIIPADHKWFTRLAVSDIIVSTLKSLHLSYPTVSEVRRAELLEAKKVLESEE
ncbi:MULTISPECIES: polyphosphate kinase 2 family protein [Leptolyngbya]|jgi:PPK2 family polyphosphate:nucleotide phosphotransferase|nr:MULTISPECIES: polyphosphate kinase 2 family protein [Leptolyngbya]BAY59104.1 polyphosphate:nucleotide phosphotransferase, PPK2 family protein [Leptolyngbya boryana NIES-2135]MBD2368148.1 polyphosphate kinase 2 family protein [Leptolyngbya sp. FACHB-161]MBD2374815.1 polyphosphate kinase 2 family protein [Leptolyngbya sp. FACHB-238]MBD2399237.1 polyphosphate kinase 2 family protein [Leptolyngbya sp. FACHB-239]MBD2405242.1 polyphosphate kinase 2 family protein [Leptolyngbya sp. FACHB-402]